MMILPIIVTFFSEAVIAECLRSLPKELYRWTIVVDNGSTDHTKGIIRKKFAKATLTERPENVGYGAGNNVGINRALTLVPDYVIVLNPDTKLFPDTISE